MNTFETERSIDLRILFFRVLKRWRILLILLAAGLLVGGGLKAIKGETSTKTVKETTPAQTETLSEEEFAEKLSTYEEKKATLESDVAKAQEDLDKYNALLEDSVTYHIDPDNAPETHARLVVSATVEDSSALNASTILSNGIRYIVFELDGRMESDALFSRLSAFTGKSIRSLREVIHFSTSSNSGTLEITVCYSDLPTAEQILDQILSYVREISGEIKAEGILTHRVDAIKGASGLVTNTSYSTSQTAMNKTLSSYEKALDTAEKALLKLSYPSNEKVVKKASTTEKKVTVRNAASFSAILKNAGIFGGIALVLGILFFVVKLLLPYKILCAGDAEQSYRLPVYGVFGSLTAKHRTGFDKWILRHLEGKTFGLDLEGHAAVVRTSSENALKDVDTLFLTSTIEGKGPDRIGEALGQALPSLTIEVLKGVASNPALFEQVPENAAVIIVEKTEKSYASLVSSELKALGNRGASVKGFILYE